MLNPPPDSLIENPPALTEIISYGDPNSDIHEAILNRYQEDPFFSKILDSPGTFKNFEVSNGRIYMRNKGKRTLCIPDISLKDRRIRELVISHAHSILAHLGPFKTLLYLRENVWWKSMSNDVQAFCESCPTCQVAKPSNQQPYGLLETLEVPMRPWETIGIDFVGPLPESKTLSGVFDMILVVIDHLTSMVHLAATKQTYRAKDIAEVMFHLVYKLHGMPTNIVSDRDTLFTSMFWQRLNQLAGVELRMSTSFHPQSDGATERANRTMVQMLRSLVSPHQKDWAIKLPAIEFAINSACSSATGYPPFVLNNGRLPPPLIWNTNSEYPGVRIFLQMMKDATMSAHDAVIAARVKSTTMANRKRKESPFVEGDLVYLSTENLSLPKGRARKLSPKYIGPFRILKDYKNNSFLLDLPSELKQRGIHPAFHAHLLRLHVPNDDRRFPGRQLRQIADIGVPEEWSVARIADHTGQSTDSTFKVEYTTGDHVWLPYHVVSRLEALGQYLESLGVPGIKHLPRKISTPPDHIGVASLSHHSLAHNLVFGFADRLLAKVSTLVEPLGPDKSPIKASEFRSPPPSIPTMPSPYSQPTPMLVDEPTPLREPGELPNPPRHSHPPGGRGGRRRGGRKGRGFSHPRQESNSDALHAFTRFFRAEAQASKPYVPVPSRRRTHVRFPLTLEELAIRKEAHAFERQIRAEREREIASHRRPPSSRHLTLDNRHAEHRRPSTSNKPREGRHPAPPARPSAAPTTTAQVIAAAVASASASPAPAPVPVPSPVTDTDAEIDALIAESETVDLETEARAFGFSTSDLFGSVLTISLGLNAVLTVLLGAMNSMNLQSGGSTA